jgi:putative ABC transport system ATP-binding protein
MDMSLAVPASQLAESPILRMENVSKTYKEGEIEVAALQSVDLQIPRRRFAMIVGPSGSGKTTLLNLIGCLDIPSTGRIEIDGQQLASLDDRALTAFRARHIGFIFQNFNLIAVLSAHENVEYGLLHLPMSAAERRDAVDEILEAVGLLSQRKQRPNQLSGGQKQRVAVARALVKKPSIVLADEPTANLDSKTGAAIVALMRDMQTRFDTSFIFSTHDRELMQHADVTFTLRDGRLVTPSPE